MKENKLDHKQKHLLKLIDKDKQEDGWTKVSNLLWPLIEKLPSEFVELHPKLLCAKLTISGKDLVYWIL